MSGVGACHFCHSLYSSIMMCFLLGIALEAGVDVAADAGGSVDGGADGAVGAS